VRRPDPQTPQQTRQLKPSSWVRTEKQTQTVCFINHSDQGTYA